MKQFLGELFEIFVLFFVLSIVFGTCNKARAESFANFGLGLFNSENSRIFNVGYRDDLIFGLKGQGEIGAWIDPAGGGRSSSAYAAYLAGVEVDCQPVILRMMAGPAVITSPDVLLGGVFPEFTEEAFAGLRDKKGHSMGVKYKHFSNAGMFHQNVGRDFAAFEVGILW